MISCHLCIIFWDEEGGKVFVWAEKKAQKLVVMCRCCDCSAKGLCVRLSMAIVLCRAAGNVCYVMATWVLHGYGSNVWGIRVPSTRVQSREQAATWRSNWVNAQQRKRRGSGYAAWPMLRRCMLGNLINWKRGKCICSIQLWMMLTGT